MPVGPRVKGEEDFKRRRSRDQKALAKRTARQGSDGVFRSPAAFWVNGVLFDTNRTPEPHSGPQQEPAS